jgi:ABC-type sugar transport system ATPase subunit
MDDSYAEAQRLENKEARKQIRKARRKKILGRWHVLAQYVLLKVRKQTEIADRWVVLSRIAILKFGRPHTIFENRKARLAQASFSAKKQADLLGHVYPMPLTTIEGHAQSARTLEGQTGTKLTLISRVASSADAQGHRFISKVSQRDFVKLVCPFANCEFVAEISFRLHG